MQHWIELEGLAFALQAERIERVSTGYLLHGEQVALLHPFPATHFYRHGFHSWSLSAWIALSQTLPAPLARQLWPQLDHPALLADYPWSSSGVGSLQSPDGQVLLLGALDLDATVRTDSQALSGRMRRPAQPGRQATWLLAWGEETQVFSSYAQALAERNGRRGQERPPRVWCSWYSLYTAITADSLSDALEGLAGLPFEVFQIDDGWQVCMGDWTPNQKFPGGMAALAEKAHQAGLRAGLWLAPLIVQPQSSLLRQHPDWLLRDAQGSLVVAGRNWGDVFYGLDTTHPGVQAWLAELMHTVRGWGYDYLKLDFLYAGALPGKRYADLPGEQAFRQGLEIMRQAAGEEAYILACGVPVMAALGLADGLRVGPDVAPIWDNTDRSAWLHDLTGPSTLNAIRTSLHRLWLRPLIQVDPDVAFFRTRYNLLTTQEKAILQDLVQITGFKATSDLPDWLDPDERAALQVFLEATPQVKTLGRYRYQLGERPVDFSFIEAAWPV